MLIKLTTRLILPTPVPYINQLSIDVDQPPKNMTVFLGRYGAFHCSSVDLRPSVDGSSTIIWFMNETLIHRLPQEYNASSVSSQRTDGVNGENSTLTVLGSELTNGTQYRCSVLDQATTTIVNYSAPVTLIVQGVCMYVTNHDA